MTFFSPILLYYRFSAPTGYPSPNYQTALKSRGRKFIQYAINFKVDSKIWERIRIRSHSRKSSDRFCAFDKFLIKLGTDDSEKLTFSIIICLQRPTTVADYSLHMDTIGTLEKLFAKPPNEVFALYLLAKYKQETGQSFD